MVRSELIALVAQRSGQGLKASDKAIGVLFDTMATALARGERIEIRGFGSWSARRYNARNGRNPKTGKRIKVPAKRLPFFRTGKQLSDRLMAVWQREQDQPNR